MRDAPTTREVLLRVDVIPLVTTSFPWDACLPFDRAVCRYAPPDSGAFRGKGRSRTRTADDERAFRKRVARRRARKGYR